MSAGKRLSTPLRILLGFSPWIAFGVAQPLGGVWPAPLALLFSLALCALDRWRGSLKAPELVAAGFFAALPLAGALGWDWPGHHLGLSVHLALAAMAFGGIALGSPFTLQYARDEWPREVWHRPEFVAVNSVITAVWGGLFLAGGVAFAVAPDVAPLLSIVATATGAVVSRRLPDRLVERALTRRLVALEPYDWPAPAVIGAREGTGSDVVVVGAGIGGLTAAAMLAEAGARVTLLEAHDRPGGFCTSWERRVRLPGGDTGRFTFDAGVHDVSGTRPDRPVGHLLRRLGVADRIEWRRVTRGVLMDGRFGPLPDDEATLTARIAAEFPDSATGVAAFLAEMRGVSDDLYRNGGETGLPHIPRDVAAMRAYPTDCPHAYRWGDTGFLEMLARFVPDAGARRLLSAMTGYISDRPERLTVRQMAPILGYLFDGGFYPKGGSQKLADALADAITARGGEVCLRTPVRRILVEGGRAAGVETADGQILRAAAVVSNADVRRTLLELVGAEHLPADTAAQARALRPSTSAFMVTLALDMLPDLPAFSFLMDEPGMAVAIPSTHDETLAPAGCAAVSLIRLAPAGDGWDRAAPDYRARKKREGDAMIAAAARVIPDLERHILHRQDASAATFARYAHTTGGAIYGVDPEQGPPPRKTPIPGLCLVGAGTFPGPGVEAAVISGRLAAEAILGARASNAAYRPMRSAISGPAAGAVSATVKA